MDLFIWNGVISMLQRVVSIQKTRVRYVQFLCKWVENLFNFVGKIGNLSHVQDRFYEDISTIAQTLRLKAIEIVRKPTISSLNASI